VKEDDAFGDRLSSLNTSSLVHSLSQSPLVRHNPHRPTAISSTRKYHAAALVDASPATNTPPSTPAPYPFASPLPSSQHLSASISSGFSTHPLYPPPGHITRNNSVASDYSQFPQQSVGLGSLSFGQPSTTLPTQRLHPNQHTPGAHEKGKFSFRSASAAPAISSQPAGGGGGAGRVDVAFLSAPSSVGDAGTGSFTPVTGVSPANSGGGSTGGGGGQAIVQSSVDVLYAKLDSLRTVLSSCMNVEQMTQIAIAMKEIGHALKALQSL
jgi:hypothetical protein